MLLYLYGEKRGKSLSRLIGLLVLIAKAELSRQWVFTRTSFQLDIEEYS